MLLGSTPGCGYYACQWGDSPVGRREGSVLGRWSLSRWDGSLSPSVTCPLSFFPLWGRAVASPSHSFRSHRGVGTNSYYYVFSQANLPQCRTVLTWLSHWEAMKGLLSSSCCEFPRCGEKPGPFGPPCFVSSQIYLNTTSHTYTQYWPGYIWNYLCGASGPVQFQQVPAFGCMW